MIQVIKDIDMNRSELYGEKILRLRKLLDGNLKISNTVAVSNELFQQFMQEKTIYKKTADYLYDFIKDKLQNPPYLFIKTSTSKYNLGILDNVLVKTTLDDIKFKIEEIYHSWQSNSANAYRITHSIDTADTYPALILQPYYDKVFSLVTRCPRTGFPTDQRNLNNVHNTVGKFELHHLSMLRHIEDSLALPAKVYFIQEEIDSEETYICNVKPELMTNDAYWVTLNDLFRKGCITEIDFLSRIKPNMISSVGNWEPLITANEGSLQFNGVPNSQGRAVGKIAFTTTQLHEIKESYILCVSFIRPDDAHHLLGAIGAISSEGGATSHLGVVSSQFGIPAVMGVNEMDIDSSSKQIRVGTQCFQEGDYMFVDGFSGKVVLSQYPIQIKMAPQYERSLKYDNLEQLHQLLMKFTSDQNIFRELPIEFQTHLSIVTQRFRQIGFRQIN